MREFVAKNVHMIERSRKLDRRYKCLTEEYKNNLKESSEMENGAEEDEDEDEGDINTALL